MIKRYTKLLIGLIVAALIAIGAYIGVIIDGKNKERQAAEEEKKKIIFSFDAEKITDMDVTNSSGDYSFRLTGNGWEIVSGDSFQIGPDKFVEIAETMSALTATKILTENLPDNLAEYGLEEPMKVGFGFSDGTSHSVDIGSKVPGDAAYYLRADGKDTIYIVSEADYEALKAEVSDLKDKFLFDTSATTDITRLKYNNHGKVVYDITRNADGWTLNAPFPRGTVNDAGVSAITSLLIRAECATFVDEELTDLSKFGFDNPSHQIEVESDRKSVKVIFGNFYDDAGKYIYAYNKAIDQIYIFETDSLGFIDTVTEDILYRRLRQENFENITGFDIDIFGTEIDIDYTYMVTEGVNYSFIVNGKDVDYTDGKKLEVFNNLINSITGIAFDYVSEDPLYNTLNKEPEARIAYSLKDGSEYVLEFYPKEDDDSLLRIVENGDYTETVIKRTGLENGVLLYYKQLMDILE